VQVVSAHVSRAFAGGRLLCRHVDCRCRPAAATLINLLLRRLLSACTDV